MTPICGKAQKLGNHLLECKWVSRNVKKSVQDEREDKQDGTQERASTSAHSEERPRKRPKQQQFTLTTSLNWTVAMREEFGADLCRVFVSNNWAWAGAQDPELNKFIDKWVPGAEIPDRRVLSGRILDQEARRYEAVAKASTKGCLATGQSDGWKNIAKSSILASVITVKGEVRLVSCICFT